MPCRPTSACTTIRAFSVVPEFGFNIGANVCKHLRFTLGYSFLFWDNVARPGNQIDRNVNPALIPSDQNFGNLPIVGRPRVQVSDELFWLHTFNIGAELHY